MPAQSLLTPLQGQPGCEALGVPPLVSQVSNDAGESWALDKQTTLLTPWGPSCFYKIPARRYVLAPKPRHRYSPGELVCPGGAQNGGEELRLPYPVYALI